MRSVAGIVLASTLFGCASAQLENRRAVDEIHATELAFARASMARGAKVSFLEFIDQDGVIFRPGPVRGLDALRSDPDEITFSLDWWPVYEGAAASGDLGFGIGPWEAQSTSSARKAYGYYATIWRRQGDGTWKFALDGAGARLTSAPLRRRDAEVTVLHNYVGRSAAETGSAAARELEDRVNAAALTDATAALLPHLAEEAWLMGSGVEPAGGRDAATAELARRPGQLTYTRLGGGGSAAGDLVYTYGSATGTWEGQLYAAHYLRVWQLRSSGWSIVLDTLSPDAN